MTQQPDLTPLRAQLAAGQHEAFVAHLVRALESAAGATQADYLRALGGEGLYLLLREGGSAALLGVYASLALAGKIHAPANVLLALNERLPSAELVALAEEILQAEAQGEPGRRRTRAPEPSPAAHGPSIQLKRVIQVIDMGLGSFAASDALGIRRSVFRSEQERTFLQALALRFPALNAFPNYPLDQVADFSKLAQFLDRDLVRYGRNCRMDAVLVVPGEGDPVAAFELDSPDHDEAGRRHLDRLKDRLLEAIQLPFFRLRAERSASIGVDEWYALLTDEVADKIDCGRRLRIRHSHPALIPV